MLLSGFDIHVANLGVMSGQKGLNPKRWGVPGHEAYLKSSEPYLADRPSTDFVTATTSLRSQSCRNTEAIIP